MSSPPSSRGPDALLAATLLAIDPQGLAGAVVRTPAGPARDGWLAALRDQLPADAPLRRVPLAIADDRMLGGLDLAATLAAGRPIAQRGVLADAHGGVVVLPMAERMSAGAAARISATLDAGELVLERDGFATRMPARFGVVALDEGAADDECVPAGLADRLAFHLDLSPVAARELDLPVPSRDAIRAARARLPDVRCAPAFVDALCGAGAALGIASLRAPWFALRAAYALAALGARAEVDADDVAQAAALVLGPRATQMPADAPPDAEPPPQDAQPQQQEDAGDMPATPEEARPLPDRVLDAVAAAMPAALLAQLRNPDAQQRRSATAGRSGASRDTVARGRPVGSRRGDVRGGARLDVLATLRAAAPWQPLRRREGGADAPRAAKAPAVLVRRGDFRVKRFRHRTPTTTIFAVDASGSSALHRLAEAKGAVELLLAECYVRRDQVALVAFRGRGAELLLPPTRSLARAKRSLAALPGGGGTPLAAGLDAVVAIAEAAQRRGETPIVVVLTDGRANVARDGTGGRARAFDDALAAARRVRYARLTAVLVDTSPQPQPQAQEVAAAMDARYVALPHAGAAAISAAVAAATPTSWRT